MVGVHAQFEKAVQEQFKTVTRGVSRIFERGWSNISWLPKKRSSDFKRGGVQWSEGGGVQYICLTRTTNLAYLDAKE